VISVLADETAQFVAVYCQKLVVPKVMFIDVVVVAERPSTLNLLGVRPRLVPVKMTLAPPTVRARIELLPRVAKYGLVESISIPRSEDTEEASTLTAVMEMSFTSIMLITTTRVVLRGLDEVSTTLTVGDQTGLSSQSMKLGTFRVMLPDTSSIMKGSLSALETNEYRRVAKAVPGVSGSIARTEPITVPLTALSGTVNSPEDIRDPALSKRPAPVALKSETSFTSITLT